MTDQVLWVFRPASLLMVLRRSIAPLLLTTLLVVASCSSRGTDSTRTPEQTLAALRSDVEFLASDDLAGRLLGEPGITEAELYIARSFEESGLTPLPGAGSYFHEFTVERTTWDEAATLLSVSGETAARGGRDITPLRYSSPSTVVGELVFAGYGISAPSAGHDDYAGLDVDNRLVLVLRGEPETNDPSSPFFGPDATRYAYFVSKAQAARRAGAAGIVVVNRPTRVESPADFLMSPQFQVDTPGYRAPAEASSVIANGFAVMLASKTVFEIFAAQWGTTAATIQRQMDSGLSPSQLELPPLPAGLELAVGTVTSQVPARNVVGMVQGTDADGWIIVGAHHDHLGSASGPGDTIFNGADDNASGASVVMELARLLAGSAPKQNIAFVTFSGEEHGLLGSTVFATAGPIDPRDVHLMVNVDMAGRNPGQPVTVHFSRDTPVGPRELQEFADTRMLPVRLLDEPLGRDDSLPFMRSGIPVIFPFSGFHEDYHGVDDEPDRLDYGRLARITGFVHDIVKAASE